jgi:hypothetical protein
VRITSSPSFNHSEHRSLHSATDELFPAWARVLSCGYHNESVAGMLRVAAGLAAADDVAWDSYDRRLLDCRGLHGVNGVQEPPGAIQQSESLARLFEENTFQTLLGIDRTLLLLRNGYEADPGHFDLRNFADRTAVIDNLTLQVSIVGPDGFMRATTTDYSGPPLYIGDREHFRAQAGDSGTDKLFISKPVMGRASSRWSIQLSRPLRGPDGGFGGIIIASLDPDYIQEFYNAVVRLHGSVILRNLDGVILAARGVSGSTIGRVVMPQVLRDALARAPAGYYWGVGAVASSPESSLNSGPTNGRSRAGRVTSPVASFRPIICCSSRRRAIVSSASPHAVRDGRS